MGGRRVGEGRGRGKVVGGGRYGVDVPTQVGGGKAAVEGVARARLEEHMQHCVADAIKAGDGTEKAKEVSAAIGRLVRS